jgi:hypothetical protein
MLYNEVQFINAPALSVLRASLRSTSVNDVQFLNA